MRTSLFLLLFVAPPVAAQAPDTVRPGGVLRADLLAATVDTIDAQRIVAGVASPVSTAVRTVARAGEHWIFVVRHEAVGNGDVTVDTTVVSAADLRLVRKAVWAATDSAAVAYRDGRVSGWAAPPQEAPRTIDTPVGGPVLPDDGILPWLWTLLPLSEGYMATIETFGTWDGALHTVTYRVVGSEQLEHHGRIVDCWVVTSDRLEQYGIHQRALVEKTSRRYIRGDAWSDDGTRYVSEVR